MIGVFRLESQMLPGNGKIERTGLGSDSKCKEAVNTAFNYLKANGNRISGSISTSTKDYIINYQDLQGIGMTDKLCLLYTSLAWVLQDEAVTSVLIGASKSEQILDNIRATKNTEFCKEELQKIEEIVMDEIKS